MRTNHLIIWTAAALAALVAICLAGCRGPETGGGLTVAGSTSVQPIAELLADEYMVEHPDRVIYVQGGGSSAGVRAVQSGAAAIGMISRELKPDETGLQQFLLARDAIALIVNPANPVRALTTDQVRDIFSRRITDWSQLGGHPGEITFITREEGSGTRSAFEEMIMGDVPIAPDAIVQDSTGASRAIVAGDRNAIAYISVGMVTPEVAAVVLDGVEPTEQAVHDGRYKLTRPFLLLTRGEPSPASQAFLEYVRLPRSQALVAAEGYIPAISGATE